MQLPVTTSFPANTFYDDLVASALNRPVNLPPGFENTTARRYEDSMGMRRLASALENYRGQQGRPHASSDRFRYEQFVYDDEPFVLVSILEADGSVSVAYVNDAQYMIAIN